MRVESQSIVLNSNKSEFRNSFYPPLQLDPKGKHEIALLNLDMYHSVPNIDESNLFIIVMMKSLLLKFQLDHMKLKR